jgi:hypothetical protein
MSELYLGKVADFLSVLMGCSFDRQAMSGGSASGFWVLWKVIDCLSGLLRVCYVFKLS